MSARKLDKPQRDLVVPILAAVLVVLMLLEYFVAPHYRPIFPWHHVPGYMGLLGLLSCLVVVILTKLIGKFILQRPEDWDERD
jgi:hypothetical protein